MISQFTCSVYYERERFSLDGCRTSYNANINFDPFPFGIALRGGLILRWPISKCADNKWRAQKFEGCGFYIPNKTVQTFIKKKTLYIKDNVLYDFVSKELAVIIQKYWRGECERCGRCCLGNEGTYRCKYLKEGIQ